MKNLLDISRSLWKKGHVEEARQLYKLAISDEEKARRKQEREDAKSLFKEIKKTLESKWKLKLKSELGKSVNPYLRLSVKGDGVIPNEFRLAVVKAMGAKPLNPDDVSYGNIRDTYISMRYSEWKKYWDELKKV